MTHALFFSLCIGYVPRLIRGAQVGRALAIAAGGATAGFVLGVPLSTSLGTALGWRTSFGVLAALSVADPVARRQAAAERGATTPRPGRPKAQAGEAHSRRWCRPTPSPILGQFTLYTFVSLLFLDAGARPAFIGPLLLLCGVSRTGRTRIRRAALWITVRAAPRSSSWRSSSRRSSASAPACPHCCRWSLAAAVWNGAFGGVPSIYQACAVRTHAVSPELAGAWVNATRELRHRGRGGDRGGVAARSPASAGCHGSARH